MSSKRSRSALEILNIKYFVLLIPFVIFLLLSSVFTGYAAPIQSEVDFVEVEEANSASLAQSTPDEVFYNSRVGQTGAATETLYTSGAISVEQISPNENFDHFIFLPMIFKSPVYEYTPEGIMLLVAYFSPFLSQQSVSAQVTLTPPNPTLDPNVTPVPTTGPGTPTYTPSPKATLTPTATSTPEFGLIPDGDFENDPTSWRRFSLKGYPIIFDDNSSSLPESPYSAFSDSHLVWLGGDDSELSYIEKEVFIEPGRPFLTHKYAIYSVDPICASNLFSVRTVATQFESGTGDTLNNLQSDVGGLIIRARNPDETAVYVLDLCAGNTVGAWGEVVYNTAPFVGRTVTIQFKTLGDSQATSGFFIDDVGLRGDIPSDFIPRSPTYFVIEQEQTLLVTREPDKRHPIPESFRKRH